MKTRTPVSMLWSLLAVVFCGAPFHVSAQWTDLSTFSYGVTTKMAVSAAGTVALYDRDKLAISVDGGQTFTEPAKAGIGSINDLEFQGADLLAVGPAPSPWTYGLYRSTGNGMSFQLVDGVQIDGGALTQVIVDGDQIVLSTNRNLMYARQGVQFREVTTPTECGYIIDADVRGQNWVIAGLSAAAMSTDGGTTWTLMPATEGGIGIGSVRFHQGAIIGGTVRGAWKWTGTAWVLIPGLPEFAGLVSTIQDLQSDPDQHLCVVATPFGGTTNVYQYVNQSWTAVDAQAWPSSHGAARGMIRPVGQNVYLHFVALSGAPKGTFRRELVLTSVTDSPALPERLRLWPNPTNGFVTIENARDPISAVYITDLTGRMVWTHTNRSTNSATLDLQHLPAGCYVVWVGNATSLLVMQ